MRIVEKYCLSEFLTLSNLDGRCLCSDLDLTCSDDIKERWHAKYFSYVIIVCLISFIFQASELSAQTKNKGEKEITHQTEGIKKASQTNAKAENKDFRKNASANNSTNTDPATHYEIDEMLWGIHFDQLPESVKHRIEANKVGGKPIMEGIAKGYLVKVNDCNSREECKSLLNFLLENKEAQDIQAVNDFSFNLIVATNQRSETLKEQLLNRGVRFSFVEEFYLLK